MITYVATDDFHGNIYVGDNYDAAIKSISYSYNSKISDDFDPCGDIEFWENGKIIKINEFGIEELE